MIIRDIIAGHGGKGADFRLAERRYGDYPGLYHMVESRPADWGLLPPVPAGKDSVNRRRRGRRRHDPTVGVPEGRVRGV